MRRRRETRGFSLGVCAVLLAANVMRIAFYFGHPFAIELLWQSVVMMVAMLLLLRLVARINASHILPPALPSSVFRNFFLLPDHHSPSRPLRSENSSA